MAYSPVVFADGTLLAATVQANLKGMTDYIGGGVVVGDLQTSSAWVDTKHIMKPSYEATTNTMSFVTGIQGGKYRTVPRDLMTVITKWNTARTDSVFLPFSSALFNFVANTAIEIRIPRNAKFLLIQYTVNPQTPWFEVPAGSPGGETQTEYGLYVAQTPFTLNEINEGLFVRPTSSSYTWSEGSDANRATTLPMTLSRKAGSGFWMMDAPSADVWYIGLVGRSDCPYTIFLNWTITVEAWI
jgi:hypothetical protein